MPDSFCSVHGVCMRGDSVACNSTDGYAGCNCASGGGAQGVRAAAAAPASLVLYPQLATSSCAKYRAAYESCDRLNCQVGLSANYLYALSPLDAQGCTYRSCRA